MRGQMVSTAADAGLGVPGYPQSATGQAVLLSGVNIPAALGYHYGPKPNADVAAYVGPENLFARLARAGKTCALLNAYPPRYFDGIDSGKRLIRQDKAWLRCDTARHFKASLFTT